jgi:hypothetical protein
MKDRGPELPGLSHLSWPFATIRDGLLASALPPRPSDSDRGRQSANPRITGGLVSHFRSGSTGPSTPPPLPLPARLAPVRTPHHTRLLRQFVDCRSVLELRLSSRRRAAGLDRRWWRCGGSPRLSSSPWREASGRPPRHWRPGRWRRRRPGWGPAGRLQQRRRQRPGCRGPVRGRRCRRRRWRDQCRARVDRRALGRRPGARRRRRRPLGRRERRQVASRSPTWEGRRRGVAPR